MFFGLHKESAHVTTFEESEASVEMRIEYGSKLGSRTRRFGDER